MPNQRHIWPFRIPSARREVQLIQQTSSWSGTSLIPPRRASSRFLLSHQGSKAPTLPDSCSGSSPAPWARAWAHTPGPGHCWPLLAPAGLRPRCRDGTGRDGTPQPPAPPRGSRAPATEEKGWLKRCQSQSQLTFWMVSFQWSMNHPRTVNKFSQACCSP